MKPTSYQFSQTYIKSKVRAPIRSAIIVTVIAGFMSLGLGMSGTWNPIAAVAVPSVVVAIVLYKNLKLSSHAAATLPGLKLELSEDTVCLIEPTARVTFPTDSIASVVIARRSQQPHTIYIERSDGSTIQFRGLDNMDRLARQLSRIAGSSKTRDLEWWQLEPH